MFSLTRMPHLAHDGLSMKDQPLGHPDLPIYRSSIIFLLGHLNKLVYATPLDADEDLVARISEATVRMREIASILNVYANRTIEAVKAYIATGGCHFEPLL
ncbi:uncharacterized protein TNCV_909501 [Trichonephila clavipes]|nr:uncharacterized protein TNCV_909501 [Trichonephila clavipes]